MLAWWMVPFVRGDVRIAALRFAAYCVVAYGAGRAAQRVR
jgi:hypothetical protein